MDVWDVEGRRYLDLTAAFGRAELAKLDGYIATVIANAGVMMKELQGIKGLILPFVPKGCTTNWYNFMDGVDGLAGGTGVIAFGLLGAHGILEGRPPFLTMAALSLACACAGAGVPPMMNYQGKLTDASGRLVADGAYEMRSE